MSVPCGRPPSSRPVVSESESRTQALRNQPLGKEQCAGPSAAQGRVFPQSSQEMSSVISPAQRTRGTASGM